MSEAVEKAPKKTEKPQKKSWFKGLKAEFKKIIWPDKKTLDFPGGLGYNLLRTTKKGPLPSPVQCRLTQVNKQVREGAAAAARRSPHAD